MSPAAVQGIAIKHCKWSKAEERGWLRVTCPRMSWHNKRSQSQGTLGVGCSWVLWKPQISPSIKCDPQIKVAPLCWEGPRAWWGVHNRKKMTFSLSFTKAIHLLQSASSEAFQMLLLCINHRHKPWGWLQELSAAEAGKGKELLQKTGRFLQHGFDCSHAAIFNVPVI